MTRVKLVMTLILLSVVAASAGAADRPKTADSAAIEKSMLAKLDAPLLFVKRYSFDRERQQGGTPPRHTTEYDITGPGLPRQG